MADKPRIAGRAGGSYLLAVWIPTKEVAALLEIEPAPDRDFETATGPVLDRQGRLPHVGEPLDLPVGLSKSSILACDRSTTY